MRPKRSVKLEDFDCAPEMKLKRARREGRDVCLTITYIGPLLHVVMLQDPTHHY